MQPFGHNRHGQKTGGLVCPFLRGAGPDVTQCCLDRPRPTPVPSGTLIHAAVSPQHVGQNWGCCASPLGASGGPHLTQCRLGRGLLPHQVASSSIQPFGHNRWAENWAGGCAPLWVCPHLTQCGKGRGLPPYQMVPSSIQPFGHNRHGPKIRDCAPLGGNWVPM